MSENDWWFLDLALVVAATGALSFALFVDVAGAFRPVVALPLVLFLPGYALVATLFPDDPSDEYRSFDEARTGFGTPPLAAGGLEATERFVLSVVFSVFLVPVVALISTLTPRGLTSETVLFGISSLTVSLTVLAIVTRYRCPPERRFGVSPSSVLPFFVRSRPDPYGRTNVRAYNVGIAIGLLALVATAGFAVANPPQHDGFTEFAVETEDVTGEIDVMYESTYVAGEPRELSVSITNREHGERTYTTVVLLERVSDDDGGVSVHEATELERESVSVPDGERRQQTLEIAPTTRGDDLRLSLLLYEGEPPAEPTSENAYRAIHLPIVVE